MKQTESRDRGVIILLFAVIFLLTYSCSSDRSSSDRSSSKKSSSVKAEDPGLDLLIKKSITEWATPAKAVVRKEMIYSAVLVENFYKERDYRPAWSEEGRLIQVESLLRAVDETYSDGLRSSYYHLGIIRSLVAQAGKEASLTPTLLADLDILLTDAFLTLSCHLSGGCVNPVTIKAEWYAKRGNVDVAAVLEQALKNKEIKEAVIRFRPEEGSYVRLRQMLAHYRQLFVKGEWPRVSDGSPLKLNSSSSRVAELRKRLAASDDLDPDGITGGDYFDEKLHQSVIGFQKRHGLKADGVVSSATLNALNVPLEQRIRQIELNMERLRWTLGNKEQRSVVVNIANFDLYVIENERSILPMKVVVGMPYWNTPVFTAKMTHLVINPTWNVPDSIAKKEILKKVKKDHTYLVKHNIKVLRGWGSAEEILDPDTIDWSQVNANRLAYRFRQEPGPLNPLGKLKFVLPNKFDVYLHDTSAKRLFREDVRTLSHGCTRVEKPLELAEYLLQGNPRWTRENIVAAIQKGAEQKVSIPRPLNVHFLYLTAWVDEGGTLQFRNDIYGRDKLLEEALSEKPSLN
ncbi:MAG: L,D-transpeptidase family protein [Nitrospirota bacterium]|nr:L,D-transpeptidase family protein [Nitrospirota bacterium]